MGDPVDEKLMAHADAVLDSTESQTLDALISAEPDLAERREAFAATRPQLVQPLFDHVLNAAPNERLIAMINAGGEARREPVATQAGRTADVLPFRPRSVKRQGGVGRFDAKVWAPAAVAASIAVVLAAGAWQRQLSDVKPDAKGARVAAASLDQASLSRVLEKLPSKTIAEVGGEAWLVKPAFTFRAGDRRWCREVNLKGEGAFWSGVACRSVDAQWRLEIIAQSDAAGAAFTDAVRPSDRPTAPPARVEAEIDRLGGGSLKTDAEERQLIDGGWPR